MTEVISYTHRFVADSGTRKKAARAFVGHAQRMRSVWVFYAFLLTLFAVILSSGMDAKFGLGTRAVWGLVYAILPTSVLAAFIAVVGYLRTFRGAKLRLFDGAVLESGFGEHEMVLRNPLAASRLSYRGVESITARGDFVFMRQHGIALVGVYPRELFPDDVFERILQTTG